MEFMPSAKDIIEQAANRAADNAGECAEDWPDASDAALAELDAYLKAWARRYVPCDFWTGIGQPERVETPREAP